MRTLVVNADDFGFTPDVNDGIIAAHRDGILTATTLMANGRAFDHALARAAENPDLDIGCHLVLVGGQSIVDGRPLPASIGDLLKQVGRRGWDPYTELRAQIERIRQAGIRPTHLDTHKHTHLIPSVLEAVARLSQEYSIPWVRRPFDFPLSGGPAPFWRRVVAQSLGSLRPKFHHVLNRRGCRITDHFAGFALTGDFGAQDLVRVIRNLPEGVTEFMCHPGFCRDELRSAQTRLKESREKELQALSDASVRAALAAENVRLARYRDL